MCTVFKKGWTFFNAAMLQGTECVKCNRKATNTVDNKQLLKAFGKI